MDDEEGFVLSVALLRPLLLHLESLYSAPLTFPVGYYHGSRVDQTSSSNFEYIIIEHVHIP